MYMLIDDQFSEFGEVAEAQARIGTLGFPANEHHIKLGSPTKFYRFPFRTLWNYKEGMSALVIKKGTENIFFYLDRVIHINPGVEFGFISIGDDSVICSGGQGLYDNYLSCVRDVPEIINGTDGFRFYMVFDQKAENGLYFRGESHEPYELVYVKNGSMNVFCDGRNHSLSSGDIMLIGKNSWHMMYSDDEVKFCTMTFLWDKESIGDALTGVLDMDAEARYLLNSIIEEDKKEAPDVREYQEALLKVLILKLKRRYEDLSASGKSLPEKNTKSAGRVLERAVRLVSENITVKYGVNELSEDLNVSRAYLTKLFNENMGMSPAKYITLMRIEESKSLLESGDIKVGQVADKMGYANIHHFSRQFTRLTGISPKKYSKKVT